MLILFLSFALLATATTAQKFLLTWLSPVFFVGLRMLTAGTILCLLSFYITGSLPLRKLTKKNIGIFFKLAVLIIFIPSCLRGWGLKQLVSSHASLIENLDPFITALYGHYLWQETMTPLKLAGIVCACAGAWLLLPLHNAALTLPLMVPAGAIIISVAVGRYGWFLAREFLVGDSYHSSEITSIFMLLGGFFALLAAASCQGPVCVTPTDQIPLFLAVFLYTVLVGNVIGYTLYAHFVKTYNMTLITLCALSVPLFVHFYGYFFLQEALSVGFFMAFGCVVLGACIFNYNHIIQTEFDRFVRFAILRK